MAALPVPNLRRSPSRRRVSVVMHWWEDRLFAGISRYAAEHDWELDGRMRWTRTTPEWAEKSDGLIINVGVKNALRSFAETMHEAGVAIVGTQQIGEYPCDGQVIVPHEAVGRLGAEHLMERNFAHLLFVIFEENALERGRSTGFTEAATGAGRPASEMHFSDFRSRLRELPRPLGLMAANDLNAIEVMRVCIDARMQIPDECAIVGVDDTDTLCRFAPVPLTSVNCNFEEQGYASAALLDRLMDGNRPGAAPLTISPAGVSPRRSTDTLAGRDPGTSRALNFIRAHFSEPIGIAEVSEKVGVPLRKLQTSFRRDVGRTMLDELTHLRVERTKVLLSDLHRKLDAIATECGFANRFHLARAFQRLTGLTPTEFRAHLQTRTPFGLLLPQDTRRN